MPKQFEVTLTFNFDENTEPEDEPKVMALVNTELVRHSVYYYSYLTSKACLAESSYKVVE